MVTIPGSISTHRLSLHVRLAYALALGAVLLTGTTPARAEPLTSEAALVRARAASPELRLALATLAAARASVDAEARRRAPVLTAGLDGQYAEQFSDTSEGATLNRVERVAADVGMRVGTDIGTQITAGLGTSSRWQTINRDPTTASSVTLGPTVAAEVSVDLTQPLLRGAGESPTLASLRLARARLTASDLERQSAASLLVRDVLSAFWTLWEAEQVLLVERAGLALSQRQVTDMQARERLGTASSTDTLRLLAEASARRQRIVTAEASLTEQRFILARLLGLDLAAAVTLATSGAPPTPESQPLTARVALALAQSPELARLGSAVTEARERLVVAVDAASTRLDLWASLAAGGLWTEGPPSGLSLPGGRPAITAQVGLALEFPLGDSSADADVAHASANVEAAELALTTRRETLTLEIARLAANLDAAREFVVAAIESVTIATRLAEQEDGRLRLGLSTPTEVISAQQSAREAELARVRAVADAARADLGLDHLTGMLLMRFPEEAR